MIRPDPTVFGSGNAELPQSDTSPSAADITARAAELHEARAEIERLRAERARLLDTQQHIMELLGTTRPERILHDLRNVLNERELFRALADVEE